jgi:uncharacterized protein YciI
LREEHLKHITKHEEAGILLVAARLPNDDASIFLFKCENEIPVHDFAIAV